MSVFLFGTVAVSTISSLRQFATGTRSSLERSNNNVLIGNTVKSNMDYGVLLHSSSNNNLTFNNLTNNGNNIYLSSSNSSLICQNNFTGSGNYASATNNSYNNCYRCK